VKYRREILKGGTALAGGLIMGQAWAQQDYPSKPIRLIVPATPGGGTDAMARLIANALGESRKWQMVVENLPGAGGNIGMEQVARSGKDGYTIGIGESSNMVINPYLYGRMPFNVETDLEPVVLLAKVPLVLVVAANSRFDSVPSLIEAARQQPLSFASAGNGTVGHLMGELWKRRVGIPMTHIPYKSAAPAMTDVAGGHVDLFFASITSALPMIKAGKVRSLAVTSATRAQLLRDVPSLSELGFKDVDASVIFGIMAPKGTPATVVSRLNIEINSVLATHSARQTLSALGADNTVYGGDSKLFSAFLWQERQKWSKVVKDSGARVD
jgi:tripartite-type tricarboxylate transporter receptor subunit TctC